MKPAIALAAACLLLAPVANAEDPPFPAGQSEQTYDGMKYYLVMPRDYDPAKEYALLIGLHGMGGDARSVAGGFADLAREGFVVCAPKSTQGGWDQPNVKKSKEILSLLMGKLSIGEKRLHGVAFSQGAGFLSSLVFDPKFNFVSASWSMGGCSGGKVPPRARKEMGAITLVGGQDWARGAAEGTVKMLAKKVRSVECHVQPGIGHEYPSALVAFHRKWLLVMDGRFTPGECATIEFGGGLESAKEEMAAEKKGALVYVYSAEESEEAETRRVQNEIFFDPMLRHYAGQVARVKADRGKDAAILETLGAKTTPAIAVLKPDGTVSKLFEGKKLKASSIAKALRSVAKDKRPPKHPGVFIH